MVLKIFEENQIIGLIGCLGQSFHENHTFIEIFEPCYKSQA